MAARSEQVRLPEARLSYPYLIEPQTRPDKPAEYTTSLVFTPEAFDEAREVLKEIAMEAARARWGDGAKDVLVKQAKTDYRLIKDGADKGYTAVLSEAGIADETLYINVKTRKRPAVLRQDGTQITETSELFAGLRVIAAVDAWTWEYSGKKGVSFGLTGIVVTGDDEDPRFDKSVSVSDVADLLGVELQDAGDVDTLLGTSDEEGETATATSELSDLI